MFRFRLQTILDVRKTIEEKALFEFSEQQQSLQKENALLQSIRERIAGSLEALRALQGKTIRTDDITIHTVRISESRKDEERQIKRIEEAKQVLNAKRQALMKAAQDRKSMEVLKEKHLEKYLSAASLAEQVANDEMTIVRHRRREPQ